jgi:GxxExxY protein
VEWTVLADDARVNQITGTILAGAIEVHRIVGPGLLESPYVTCLKFELTARGLSFVAQQPISMSYKSMQLEAVYRADLIVEDTVVVEVKSVESLTTLAKSQLLTYVRLASKPAGLLINFNVERLMDGVRRVLNTTSRPRR